MEVRDGICVFSTARSYVVYYDNPWNPIVLKESTGQLLTYEGFLCHLGVLMSIFIQHQSHSKIFSRL
jgi:hypothetical protein